MNVNWLRLTSTLMALASPVGLFFAFVYAALAPDWQGLALNVATGWLWVGGLWYNLNALEKLAAYEMARVAAHVTTAMLVRQDIQHRMGALLETDISLGDNPN